MTCPPGILAGIRSRVRPSCAALSAVLCFATLALWCRSHRLTDQLDHFASSVDASQTHTQTFHLIAMTAPDDLLLGRLHEVCDANIPYFEVAPGWSYHQMPPATSVLRAGQIYGVGHYGWHVVDHELTSPRHEVPFHMHLRFLVLPLWLPAVAFAILPLHFAVRVHHRRRAAAETFTAAPGAT